MAHVMAEEQQWNSADLSFEVVHTLSGAVKALKNGDADYFMWEHFTTKPLVQEGVFEDCLTALLHGPVLWLPQTTILLKRTRAF